MPSIPNLPPIPSISAIDHTVHTLAELINDTWEAIKCDAIVDAEFEAISAEANAISAKDKGEAIADTACDNNGKSNDTLKGGGPGFGDENGI